MKFLKYLKYLLIVWLLVTLAIGAWGIIKYNMDLNTYVNKQDPERSEHTNQLAPETTEVYIVGSVHFETTHLKRDDLYKYISDISPSVILYESDTKTVERMLNRTDFMRQLMSTYKKGMKVESFVCHRYLKHHPQSKIMAYEWEERDAFQIKHQLSRNSNHLLNRAIQLHRDHLLSNDESKVIIDYLAINKAYNKIGGAQTMKDINNQSTDSIIRHRQALVYKAIPDILKERKEADDLQDFIPFHMTYWDTRNQAMVTNIIRQIEDNPNKKIVVLTGYSHRYYLSDALKQYETEFNFSLEEI